METVKIADAREFDEFVYSHPKGHMMQTSAWGKVKKEWDWTGFIARDDEGRIKGVCAVLIRQIPMTPFRMMYAPRGPVCDLSDEETVKELLTAAAEYGKKNRAYTLKIDTDTPVSNEQYISLLKSMAKPKKRLWRAFTQKPATIPALRKERVYALKSKAKRPAKNFTTLCL